MDDTRLRAHLERRTGEGEPPVALARVIAERVRTVGQDRSGPAARLEVRRGWLALAAVLAGVALVFGSLGGIRLPMPAPSAALPILDVLSPDELVRLVTQMRAEWASAWADRVVIVDADLEWQLGRCRAPGPCAVGFVSGTDPRLSVIPDSDPTFRSSGYPSTERYDPGGTLSGPIALRLSSSGAVELIAPVAADEDTGLVWSLESFRAETARLANQGPPAGSDGVALGPLFVVDAWLAQSPFAPPCPPPSEDTPTSLMPYLCGIEAWLGPESVRSGELDTPAAAPAGGVRIQNGAYDSFASNPARTGSLDTPQPRRGLYLVRSILEFPLQSCASCTRTPAYVVARIDPISPPDSAPSPSSAPPSLTVLGAEDFARLVTETPVVEWRDRVVIVDAGIESRDFFCAFDPIPAPCPIGHLAGTEVLVWPDPAPVYEDDVDETRQVVEFTGPHALRLASTGHVELIGSVRRFDGAIAWQLDSMVTWIRRLQTFEHPIGPDGIAVGPLFVVDAGLVSPMAPECPAPAGSPPQAIAAFACGQAAFLTPERVQLTYLRGSTLVTLVPAGSVRVQNWAYDRFAPNPGWSSEYRLAEPRRALYLVRSIVDFPRDSCFMCEAAGQAFVVARIDPIEVPPAGEN